MPNQSTGSAGVAVLLLLAGLALAAANLAVVAGLGSNGPAALAALQGGDPSLLLAEIQAIAAGNPLAILLPAVSPILLALVAAARGGGAAAAVPAAPTAAVVVAEAPKGPPPETSALRLLGLLQQEARFIDFISENIDDYDDAQVGAAVRQIHADCRKALAERVRFERVFQEEEGETVNVAAGFDATAIRLTGNVTGEPPFRGTLQHSGWRAVDVRLPVEVGDGDARVIQPAEVEVA